MGEKCHNFSEIACNTKGLVQLQVFFQFGKGFFSETFPKKDVGVWSAVMLQNFLEGGGHLVVVRMITVKYQP